VSYRNGRKAGLAATAGAKRDTASPRIDAFPPSTGWAVMQSYRRVKYPPLNILEELQKKAT
jgi:hypothetical protein